MSTRGLKRPLKGYVRDARRRKMVLDVDLNVAPPGENRVQEGETTSHAGLQDGQVNGQDHGPSNPVDGRLNSVPIDVEAIDDEVVISSPRSFTEARSHSRRNHVVTVVLDEDSDVQQGQSGSVVEEPATRLTLNSYGSQQRNPTNETVINCELYINCLEHNLNGRQRKNVGRPSPQNVHDIVDAVPEAQPKTLPTPEPTFTCPVCMGPLEEPTSTNCGHIFCKACIRKAITTQKKCPTCRHKVTMNLIHRVYLPTAT